MDCSRCVDVSRRSELRIFWRLIAKEDKRRFVTVVATIAGAGTGWLTAGGLGVLAGMFLAGCVGEIAGLARWGDAARLPVKKTGEGLQR